MYVDRFAEVGGWASAYPAAAESLAEAVASFGAGLLLFALEGPHGGA